MPWPFQPLAPGAAQLLSDSGGISLPTGLATETDSALAGVLVKLEAVGVGAETDAAVARTLTRLKATGLASETDTAGAVSATKNSAIGRSDETDAALAPDFGAGAQTIPTGRADELDTSLATSLRKALSTAVSIEGDTGLSGALMKRVAVDIALESDAAQAAFLARTIATQHASEADSGSATAIAHHVAAGPAGETDSAFRLALPFSVQRADESDTAHAPTLAVGSASAGIGRARPPKKTIGEKTAERPKIGPPTPVRVYVWTAQEYDSAFAPALLVERAPARPEPVEQALTIGQGETTERSASPALRREISTGTAAEHGTADGFGLRKAIASGAACECNAPQVRAIQRCLRPHEAFGQEQAAAPLHFKRLALRSSSESGAGKHLVVRKQLRMLATSQRDSAHSARLCKALRMGAVEFDLIEFDDEDIFALIALGVFDDAA